MENRKYIKVGVAGPVGSGKTALLERLSRKLFGTYDLGVITNDIYTKEDAEFMAKNSLLPHDRIIGVETGGCPHTAIREDASINLEAIDRMLETMQWVLWLEVEQRHLVWMRAERYRWKEICCRFGCDRTTAWRRWRPRWRPEEARPVHRHEHALRADLVQAVQVAERALPPEARAAAQPQPDDLLAGGERRREVGRAAAVDRHHRRAGSSPGPHESAC